MIAGYFGLNYMDTKVLFRVSYLLLNQMSIVISISTVIIITISRHHIDITFYICNVFIVVKFEFQNCILVCSLILIIHVRDWLLYPMTGLHRLEYVRSPAFGCIKSKIQVNMQIRKKMKFIIELNIAINPVGHARTIVLI